MTKFTQIQDEIFVSPISMVGKKPHLEFDYQPEAHGDSDPALALGLGMKLELSCCLPQPEWFIWWGRGQAAEGNAGETTECRGDLQLPPTTLAPCACACPLYLPPPTPCFPLPMLAQPHLTHIWLWLWPLAPLPHLLVLTPDSLPPCIQAELDTPGLTLCTCCC